jgi:preprotein translocase subunit SecE
MARQTRQQRRAQRALDVESGGAEPPDSGSLEPTANGEGPEEPAEKPAREGRRGIFGVGIFRYISESWAELQKVEWPKQRQLIAGTTVVIVACAVTGVYLYACDEVFKRFVQNVLLGQ